MEGREGRREGRRKRGSERVSERERVLYVCIYLGVLLYRHVSRSAPALLLAVLSCALRCTCCA